MRSLLFLFACVGLAALAQAQTQDAAESARRASFCGAPAGGFEGAPRLLAGLGDFAWPVSGATPLAQRWFDQGLVLAWGFNFAAAEDSLREATRSAPECAMCWWGQAYVVGPSVNHDLNREERVRAHQAIERAAALSASAPPLERRLIAALRLRHAAPAEDDRSRHEAAYEAALAQLVRERPRDAQLQTLLAEARMAQRGRQYWARDGVPMAWTGPILQGLELALALAPAHPGANHLYVHALEDAPPAQVERALASARRLAEIAPGVGHLVHMPAHVYFRLGRYEEAMRANEAAIEADRASFGPGGASAAYEAGYGDHNHHFLWASAMMAGRAALALQQAELLAAAAARHPAGSAEHLRALPLYTEIRFGEWQKIAARARPTPHSSYTDSVWHVARGLAALRASRAAEAQAELVKARQAAEAVRRKQALFKNTHELGVLAGIASDLLGAEVAAAQGDRVLAIVLANRAVAAEDALEFDEPPAWHMPARHTLGALLLEGGQARAALEVYRRDLALHPDNGWALRGLSDAQSALGQSASAAKTEAAFRRVWTGADRPIKNSRF